MSYRLSVHEILKDLRVAKKMTLVEVERKSGIAQSTIQSYEADAEYADDGKKRAGTGVMPPITNAAKLADVYGVSLDVIAGRNAEVNGLHSRLHLDMKTISIMRDNINHCNSKVYNMLLQSEFFYLGVENICTLLSLKTERNDFYTLLHGTEVAKYFNDAIESGEKTIGNPLVNQELSYGCALSSRQVIEFYKQSALKRFGEAIDEIFNQLMEGGTNADT